MHFVCKLSILRCPARVHCLYIHYEQRAACIAQQLHPGGNIGSLDHDQKNFHYSMKTEFLANPKKHYGQVRPDITEQSSISKQYDSTI